MERQSGTAMAASGVGEADDTATREAASAAVAIEGVTTEEAPPEPLPPRVADRLAAIFAALGEPRRLRIVHALSGGERNVSDLAATLGMAVPAVSQHLRILRDLRIVRNRREGKMVYYALDDAHVADLFAVTLAHVLGTEER